VPDLASEVEMAVWIAVQVLSEGTTPAVQVLSEGMTG
jgi:hypothetical protein